MLGGGYGFWRRIAFHVHQWRYQSNLQLDLLAPKCGSGGQRRDLVAGRA